MPQSLIQIAVDWATRCFGVDQMNDPPTRALRLVEEAVELAQAVGVRQLDVSETVNQVYNKKPGNPYQKMGGVYMTAHLMAHTLARNTTIGYGMRSPFYDYDPEEVFLTELRRVLDKEAGGPGVYLTKFETNIVRDPETGLNVHAKVPHNDMSQRRVPRFDDVEDWVPDEYDEGDGG